MKSKRENLFATVSVPCYDWKGEDGSIQISWGCSRGAFCKDKNCRYSHAAEQGE